MDALRFRLEFGLGGDPQALEDGRLRLEAQAPHHPLTLNLRAWRALPETALPPPPPALREAAERFLAGDLTDALARARTVDAPRALVVQADLLLLLGRVEPARAALRAATRALGPLPPLIFRDARCAELSGDPDEAWSACVEALVGNPLYGSARRLQLDLVERRGGWLLPLPLRITPELGPETLEGVRRRWSRSGLLEVHDRVVGLSPESAESFRAWALREEEALRRFFAEGLVLGR
ncbi:MAG: hypothetical protein H6741_11275 [Alphaproteobacteria bacterium]|nr:hypothetical protein [Alphaproteobacteria bacterium]